MKHIAEYALIRAAGVAAGVLPAPGRRAIGRSLGSVVYALDSRHRNITLENVDRAFGDEKSAAEKRAIAEGAFRHFGAMLFEMITLGRPGWKDLEGRFEFEGAERYEEARQRGKGVILVAAHFGNWELHAIAHGYRFGRIHLVAREQDNLYLNRWLEEIRGISGNQIVYKNHALAQTRKLIRDGETVAIVTDQNVHLQDAVFVDFFGRKAAATPIAAWFALKTGAALVPAFTYPRAAGRYHAIYENPLDLEKYRNVDRDTALAAVTQELAAIQERHIRNQPDCWLWMHRRWRTRPPEQEDPPLPARERVSEAALT
ncbi:MAG TPA: lysophospholipid acyltransferase family protein [Vicinamibacteria bacterium]|jgi:KDO2-lipid IV(A) lauroyltransferase